VKFVPELISRTGGRSVLLLGKHSPTILFAAGIVGVVGTAVLASKATLKVDEIITEHEKEIMKVTTLVHADYSDQDRKRDTAIVYARTARKLTVTYAPAVLTGVATIGLLSGSHHILTKRNVALTVAYNGMARSYQALERAMRRGLGDDKFEELVHNDIVTPPCITDSDSSQEIAPKRRQAGLGYSPYAKFFDEKSQNWEPDPSQNLMFLRCQVKFANDLLRSRGHLFLNEVYDMLGLERTKAGAVVGWVFGRGNGDNYVDFGIGDDSESALQFIRGFERSVWLDFNVDGVIYDQI
jgi:Family of unknown function (DUF6353)